MPKQRIKFDEEITAAIKVLCEYHELNPEELFIKLVMDEWNREYKGIQRKGLA